MMITHHNTGYWMLAAGMLALLLPLISCSPQQAAPPEKECTTAEDCVKTQCCHAADAVNKAYAPDCQEIFCTLECAPQTLDCGQGEIQCIQGECTAVIYQ